MDWSLDSTVGTATPEHAELLPWAGKMEKFLWTSRQSHSGDVAFGRRVNFVQLRTIPNQTQSQSPTYLTHNYRRTPATLNEAKCSRPRPRPKCLPGGLNKSDIYTWRLNEFSDSSATANTRSFITTCPQLVTSPTEVVAKYCDEYVCLSVCLSDRISLESHARSLPIFCACCPSPWLGPPLARLR